VLALSLVRRTTNSVTLDTMMLPKVLITVLAM
jgi:hypothetical protein